MLVPCNEEIKTKRKGKEGFWLTDHSDERDQHKGRRMLSSQRSNTIFQHEGGERNSRPWLKINDICHYIFTLIESYYHNPSYFSYFCSMKEAQTCLPYPLSKFYSPPVHCWTWWSYIWLSDSVMVWGMWTL